MLRNKFNMKGQAQPHQQSQVKIDPLKTVEIDVQSGDEKLSDEQSEANSEHTNQLDQTIVIGEMEEGNIFDEMKQAIGSESKDDQ